MQSIDPDKGIGAWDNISADYVYDNRINFQDDVFLRFMASKVELAQKYAADNGISNARFMERSWDTYGGEKFAGKNDIGFAHTTPAIADHSTYIKSASPRYDR